MAISYEFSENFDKSSEATHLAGSDKGRHRQKNYETEFSKVLERNAEFDRLADWTWRGFFIKEFF